jgi:CRP/FNR family transcriptional regulator, cyclic AMP receptor protein
MARMAETAFHKAQAAFHGVMADLFSVFQDHPVRQFEPGQTVLGQGDSTGMLYILIEGRVEVVKDGMAVARCADAGAVFGDLSALLAVPHTAEVRTVTAASFYQVTDAAAFLERHPALSLHLCRLLARRLDAVNKYLVDVKQQFSGHDHLAMVDGMLDTLMHRQPRAHVPPKASTLTDPEAAD